MLIFLSNKLFVYQACYCHTLDFPRRQPCKPGKQQGHRQNWQQSAAKAHAGGKITDSRQLQHCKDKAVAQCRREYRPCQRADQRRHPETQGKGPPPPKPP